MYNEKATETNNIKAINTDGTIELFDTSNEEIHIIQIRVYDDDGNFVESFDVDRIISGNTKLDISPENLPVELREMLVQ